VIDEDTCATNFMIRDERMKLLVNADKEPIQPFISRVKALRASCGVSTVLVVGGCGEYFDVADSVILMDNFVAVDATVRAKGISAKFANKTAILADEASFPSYKLRAVSKLLPRDHGKTHVRQINLIEIGDEKLDLACVEQIADISQTRALADIIIYFDKLIRSGGGMVPSVAELLDKFEVDMSRQGLDVLSPGRLYGHYALPRRFEIAAALNRLRSSVFSTSVNGGHSDCQAEPPGHVYAFAGESTGIDSKRPKHCQ